MSPPAYTASNEPMNSFFGVALPGGFGGMVLKSAMAKSTAAFTFSSTAGIPNCGYRASMRYAVESSNSVATRIAVTAGALALSAGAGMRGALAYIAYESIQSAAIASTYPTILFIPAV